MKTYRDGIEALDAFIDEGGAMFNGRDVDGEYWCLGTYAEVRENISGGPLTVREATEAAIYEACGSEARTVELMRGWTD